MIKEIIVAGDNLGALALYKGLVTHVDKISVYTNTQNIFEDLRPQDQFIDSFFSSDARVVICSAYAPLVPIEHLRKKKFLNIHYAPLPKYRGMHPIVWGIINNESHLGWTFHEMDEFMDSGPIIYQYKIKNDYSSSSMDYMNLFHESVSENIGRVVSLYCKKSLKPIPQKKSLATWGIKRSLADCKLDFSFSHQEIKNFFRALVDPYPLPFIQRKCKKYFITKYKLHDQNIKTLTLGRITNIDNEGMWIKVRDGYLVVKELVDELQTVVDFNMCFRIGNRLS
ncbi:MAG: hypothetical protein K0T99_02515 [Alphaproteobacteria bacterium]|nr:hypothetical protein [Alphaproteobacteria bacterium]